MTETTPSSNPPNQAIAHRPQANGTQGGIKSTAAVRSIPLRALYQHIVGRNDAAAIDAFTRDWQAFKTDRRSTTTLCFAWLHQHH